MKFLKLGLAGALAAVSVGSAHAAETINVAFTQPNGGTTTGLYSGIVHVRVSGTGFSLGSALNDAFYLLSGPVHDASYYQLTFGTSPLVAFNPSLNAVNFVVGGLPAYQASHIYDFFLNTGSAVPTALNFGVGDGQFGDNGGSFLVSVGVPEPATWAMLIVGFGMVGAGMRSARRRTSVRFA